MSDTGSDTNGSSPFELVSEGESGGGQATPLTATLTQKLHQTIIFEESPQMNQNLGQVGVDLLPRTNFPEANVENSSAHTMVKADSAAVPAILATGEVQSFAVAPTLLPGIITPSPPISVPSGPEVVDAQQQLSSSPKSPRDDVFAGWFSGNTLLGKVVSSAKNSVDSMITTLDPGMKEYIFSGGDVSILVASDKDNKVSPVRDAFIDVFGRATVRGIAAHSETVAAQPVGCASAIKAAEDRIKNLRVDKSLEVAQNQVIVAIENCLVEMTPDHWYDIGCIVLDEPLSGSKFVTYTQATPIAVEHIKELKSNTPDSYPLKSTGFTVTIGQLLSQKLDVNHENWHEEVCGVNRKSVIYLAACALARIFKDKVFR
ncbi:Protein PRRC1 [Halotydeus destructor]|nr:Protein PRRC1 [Halotydeus destructor]